LVINSLFIARAVSLILSLAAFYQVWSSHHLLKKVLAWLTFQISIALLWLSSSYPYHHHLNPLPQVLAFVILLFSLGILGIMLVFVLGVLRRHHSLEIEKMDHEGAA
jgi:multisubunit Na+/H+ antiporter MnhC subunit